jgi:formamidopyrimidine-DNA glycosylase
MTMPELPEVETTRQGIKPYLENSIFTDIKIRQFSLRWPIEPKLGDILQGQSVNQVNRRAKYLLLNCDDGTLIIHLGMSGSLRILDKAEINSAAKHDHVDFVLANGHLLRYTDPRRFGAILWTTEQINDHKLIAHLGPEPLSKDFDADYLLARACNKKISVKSFVMNGQIVVGVGNIYASESLFLAGIHPQTPAMALTQEQAERLVEAIKSVLAKAIAAGGTTLKDFTKSDGKPGYFSQQLNVYGRKEKACFHCGNTILHYKEQQRATYYCPQCQKLK